ncbi:hypothetical protein LTR78_005682 [Recurvomyces mirabilis]|uniref:Tetratricopeptide SHNi-TPR domain-containing protein n=1 Tax=Recurvomyces mirabilis TaxID=574656 RepID=A0AAE0WMT6_9PEZI|nr:hypothetical protein LTR78_005682 [Recurvomyces mirabilis]KAK5151195.1 hypothetical protein LTS14_009365 [Recurvomyces mirabilis]
MADETIQEHQLTPAELVSQLDKLKANATQQYSLKNYDAAAELYSEAAEVQDQINGEMSLDNADLLYQYGRCLYHVAVSRSDVLGGKVASTEEPKRKKRKIAESSASRAAKGDGEQQLAEDVVEAVVEEKDGMKDEADIASKPFFQITGDENWTDSEDEEEQADAEAEEEEDDFATAFEILDTARVLLRRRLEAAQQAAGKVSTEHPEVRQLQERLADTHDLQAEISLENERFQDAIGDTRDSLALKLQLYPQESSLIAEAHFKLSLALEFSSVTSTADDEDGRQESKVAQVDEKMRTEAADEMEKAIASCKLRISKEETLLASSEDTKTEERRRGVADVKEMVADMEQRLVDLRNPAVSLSGAGGPAGAPDGGDPLRGVLGAMLGESRPEQEKRIADATAQANDLSGLVKHKKKPRAELAVSDATNGATADGKGKRKSEEVVDGEAAGSSKRARVEDA